MSEPKVHRAKLGSIPRGFVLVRGKLATGRIIQVRGASKQDVVTACSTDPRKPFKARVEKINEDGIVFLTRVSS